MTSPSLLSLSHLTPQCAKLNAAATATKLDSSSKSSALEDPGSEAPKNNKGKLEKMFLCYSPAEYDAKDGGRACHIAWLGKVFFLL